jgi:transketolase
LPTAVRARVSVEAGVPMGWRDLVGDAGEIIAIDHFGASADAATLFREFGFTPDKVVAAAKRSRQGGGEPIRGPQVPQPSAAWSTPPIRRR